MKPAKIILISGVNGIGKTTLGFKLAKKLDIRQRISLGTIIKTLIAYSDQIKQPELEKLDNHFVDMPTKDLLYSQAQTISKAVNLIIEKYNQQGVNCIVEGVQLLPRFLNLPPNTIHIHLGIKDLNKYRKQLNNPDTRTRIVNDQGFSNLVILDKILQSEMSKGKVRVFYNSDSTKDIVSEIIKII